MQVHTETKRLRCSEDNKMLFSAKLWKNSLCIAFLLIPTLGKSGWTLFLMKIQTASVRTWSFVHFILLQIRLQTRNNLTQDFKKDWNLKTMLCEYIRSDSNVAKQVWVTYYMITIALLLLVLYEYLCVFNLNHSSVHLWRMYTVKHTTISQS